MPAGPYTVNLDEQGIAFTLRLWKSDAGWTWSGQVGSEPVVNDGTFYKSVDSAQAFGETECREIARAWLTPKARRTRLERELDQARMAHELAVAAVAPFDGRGLRGALWKTADAEAIRQVSQTLIRVDELKAELAKLND